MQTIAILEPDSIIALDIATSIEHAQLATTEIFRSTEEAFQRVRPSTHSLILIDIGDDRQHEIDAAIEMRRSYGMRCLIFSDHAISKSLPKLREAEPLGFLVKPFSSQELLAVVESALYRSDMEEKLQISERRYRNLFQYSLSARCIVSSDGSILERNSVFERSFPSTKLHNIKDLFSRQSEWKSILENAQKGEILQNELKTHDFGEGVREVICSASMVAQSQESSQIAIEIVDVTELRRTREELFQSQKQEEIGRITSGVAHDLNNFLTSITGYLEMLKLDIPEGSTLNEDIQGIEKTILKTSTLTKQLLGFSRKKSFEPRTIDLREILSDSMKMLKRLMPENIAFTLTLPNEPVEVVADAGHIEQTLLNLVVNARDAVERVDDPRIEISLTVVNKITCLEKQSTASIAPLYAQVEVRDNGTGIEQSALDHIFEPFFTTKEAGKGTGLGLSIAKSLVEMNGGKLCVSSELGHGSAFTIVFPELSRGAAKESESHLLIKKENVEDLPAHLLKDKKILIVDDDASVLESCGRALRRAGASVVLCGDGKEALSACTTTSFDLLLSDIVLPKMTGIELWELVQRASHANSCLFMTGYDSNSATEKFPESEVIFKPFIPSDLVYACARAIKS